MHDFSLRREAFESTKGRGGAGSSSAPHARGGHRDRTDGRRQCQALPARVHTQEQQQLRRRRTQQQSVAMRWGILGSGKIASDFATALSMVPGASVQAVASRRSGSADDFAANFDIPQAFSGSDAYKRLAACDDVDICYIATLNPSHKSDAIACLEAGKCVAVPSSDVPAFGGGLIHVRFAFSACALGADAPSRAAGTSWSRSQWRCR